MTSTERSAKRKVGVVLLWVITVLDAAMMTLAGLAKFGGAGNWWALQFETWGYPDGFSLLIGAAEVGLAVVMLVPRFASWAAAGLIVIMLGALGTVLLNPGRLGPGTPIMHLVVLSLILAARWNVRWKPSGSSGPQPQH